MWNLPMQIQLKMLKHHAKGANTLVFKQYVSIAPTAINHPRINMGNIFDINVVIFV